MSDFVKLTSEGELPGHNEAKEFAIGEKMVCIANVDGTFSAMDNVCLHRGGPLGQGVVEGTSIICPWHGWAWDLKTGEAGHNPAAKVAMYPLKIENGEVLIKL